MTDEEIMTKIDKYVRDNNLKKMPIDKSFPIIIDFAMKVDKEYGQGRSGGELLHLYTDWLSVWMHDEDKKEK